MAISLTRPIRNTRIKILCGVSNGSSGSGVQIGGSLYPQMGGSLWVQMPGAL